MTAKVIKYCIEIQGGVDIATVQELLDKKLSGRRRLDCINYPSEIDMRPIEEILFRPIQDYQITVVSDTGASCRLKG